MVVVHIRRDGLDFSCASLDAYAEAPPRLRSDRTRTCVYNIICIYILYVYIICTHEFIRVNRVGGTRGLGIEVKGYIRLLASR